MANVGDVVSDVLFGLAGELFLASGGHRVLEYATGSLPIDDVTVEIFRRNIIARVAHARTAGASYLHVVYPDKQSALPEKFITADPVRLGPYFLNSLGGSGIETLYPLEHLQQTGERIFLQTDTHLSDFGTIIVSTRIAEILMKQDLSIHRGLLTNLLTVQRQHSGDLGRKLNPPVESLETFALLNWKKFYFRNEIPGGNNGGVDIYFAPQALFARRLLWFGDSFGRETVRFLSYFFSEILFLRTPFYHSDIVEQMRPDLIISSNVERYLASVVPDENRPLFFMYPFLTGRGYEASSEFAEAFSAILSYPRPVYNAFVRRLFAGKTVSLPTGVQTVQHPAIDQAVPPKPEPAMAQLAPPNTISIPQAANAVAATMKIIPYIHENDFIFKFVARKWGDDKKSAFVNYFELGKYSAKIAADLIEEVVRVKKTINQQWGPSRLLDFASGYGGVARHLANVFPNTLVTTCDIHDEAVKFNRDVLGLESYLSSPTPEALAVPQQDVIVAMSFFSHMPNATYTRWLQSLANRLEPGGVLIFTANGFVTEMRGTTGVKAGDNGFGFEPRSEQKDLDGGQYGITVSHPRWVIRALEQIPEIRLARFQEGHWWAIQDTYVCIRTS